MKVSNWGKYPVIDVPVFHYRGANGQALPEMDSWIPRGMGRCYGDAALGENILSRFPQNRCLAFDPETGILKCEAGLSYAELLKIFVPKGWFPYVTPGTKFVSIGGAVASDVHGKNHHNEGSIGQYLLSMDILTASGEIMHCSPKVHADLFWATIGGMGLTGLILNVELQLKAIQSAAIRQESIKARNLDEILELYEIFDDVIYSVAWIDCLSGGKSQGRSILMKGDHAQTEEISEHPTWRKNPFQVPDRLKLSVPFDLPSFALNKYSIKAFNALYYHKQFKKELRNFVSYEPFFYPLDFIHHWNRIYGKRGFTQYQLVLPMEAGKKGIRDILERTRKAGLGSFLAVLKTMGPPSNGLLSFPLKGYTLTLDFPISNKLFPFLKELDAVVVSYGGRIYLTKDVRLEADMMAKMYPNVNRFKEVIRTWDPDQKIRSLQSIRLGLHDS